MYKLFFLTVAIALTPFTGKFSLFSPGTHDKTETAGLVFNFKNTNPANPFEPEKKSGDTWSQGWMTSAREYIRRSEYNFTWEEKLQAYCTPNRKNNLRFFYNDKGFSVEPGRTKIPIGNADARTRPDKVSYRQIPHWKVIFNLDKKQTGTGTWQVENNKALYIGSKITVQYINGDDGMRQNFIVQAPLTKKDELNINFRVKTKLQCRLTGKGLQFFHNNTNVLDYKDLKVWDANGKTLKACFKKNKTKNGYSIQADAKNAAYPITIDPLSSTPDNTPDDADQGGAFFGMSVASAGDVNGDGYSDVIIGAYSFDDGANTNEGRAFVYHGSATGLSASPNSTPDDADQAGAAFGYSVSSAGDVNGDGYSDVIIGAQAFNDGANGSEGRAFMYYGSVTGISASPNSTPDDANQANALFGISVACAGDVNGDGYSDVIIGAIRYDDGANVDEGRAFVYHGSATGLSASPNNTPDDANQINALFGVSVASAGDVNGDGYSDVIIGASGYDDGANTNEGRAFVYYGSATGLSGSPNSTPDDANQADAQFGYSVASAGDVNGDGYSDVIIGADFYDDGVNTNEGRAFVYYGSAAGLSGSPNSTPDDANQAIARFGYSVACAGDVNGDGYSDVIIGAIYYDEGLSFDEGRAFVYYGSATGLSASPNSTPDDADQAGANFGASVASAGDVNGDGYSDVIIGASQYDDGANINEGRAFVYHGSAAGLSSSPANTPDDADQANAFFGVSVACAGDVNGDGYSDVIIGAYQYDDGANTDEGRAFVYYGSAAGLSAVPNSTPDDADQAGAYFGYSVSSAGDVNGDGYSDVIIGAYRYDDGANVDEGRAFVYHGSATGLSASPNSAPDDADQANTSFGYSVASAGDVNGDGYSDVIIGAYRYDDGANIDEGKAFVYHGSATGLSASPNSMPDDADQSGAYFGCSVANAGDVNADGYSDVIIGATFYDDGANFNEGRAFVYYGSATGLSASPNSTPDDADQTFASFGISVASAGDVNGDGFSDVIIGAFFYSDGVNFNEGRAFVYYGSATGLSASPNSMPDDADQAEAYFGYSVASAGDLNGDGYSDVVIGAYQFNDGANLLEGRAFVYYGSPTGLAASPASTPGDANQAFASFGVSVASAGDVNGDGYSDIIIGAYQFNDGANSSEGRAFVYQGNELVSNRRNNLRLYNTDLATPINSSNFISGIFGAGLYARSFLGKGKGKMVWETRLNYNAYSGTPITNSTFFTAEQATFTDMGITGIELKNLVDKIGGGRYTKMRARIKYDPVTAITGQVYSPWRNVSSIIDANNPGVLPIELISFNAAWQQKGKTVKLDFKTDKEGGICCFDIEKSSDGFNFYSIGTLQANNISGIQSYSFIDTRANAKNQYYRIKIKGINGRHVYSNIQQLQFNRATEILLFPNPTTDLLQLQLNKAYNKLNIGIFNEAGQLVYQQTLPATDQVISVPVQKLAAGKYWLHLQSAADKQVLQFVKQ